MGRIRKFLHLPAADRRFLLKVALLVSTVRTALWILPFGMVLQLLRKFSHTKAPIRGSQDAVERIAWAVTVSSRYVPAATCLSQALVTKVLLGRFGHHASVRIGVARSDAGQLQAHAWVETDGKIVVGGSESSLKHYTPLTAANGELW